MIHVADFILDASALAKEIVEEVESPRFRSWHDERLREGARVESCELLPYEMAQVGRRLGRYQDAVRLVEGMRLHRTFADLAPFLEILTAYDASYLAAAQALGATLVTYDAGMLDAAAKHGIAVVSP